MQTVGEFDPTQVLMAVPKTDYPHCLGPVPIATAASSAWLFRPFTMAEASETATGKWPPYPGETTTHRGLVRLLPDLSQSLDVHLHEAFPCVPPVRVVAGDALKADQAAATVANASTKAVAVVVVPQQHGYVSSDPPGHATRGSPGNATSGPPGYASSSHEATLPAAVQATQACGKAVIPATPVPTMAAIVTTNGAVPLIVSRPPATAVAQATGTVTTTKTAAPTKTTGATAATARRPSTRATPHRDQTPSAALPPTATNATLSDAAQYDSRSLAPTNYTLVVYLLDSTLSTCDGKFTTTYDEDTGLYVIATQFSPRIDDPTSTVLVTHPTTIVGTPLPPAALDPVALKLIDPITEYLAEHLSAKLVEARAAKAALMYAFSSDPVHRKISSIVRIVLLSGSAARFSSEEKKFASDVDFDKLHKTVEIRESTTLTDSHLASVSLSSLPDCIEHDVQVWPGARPSIPDTQLREFLPQHWYELTKLYHDFLGPKPTASTYGGLHESLARMPFDETSSSHLDGSPRSNLDNFHPIERTHQSPTRQSEFLDALNYRLTQGGQSSRDHAQGGNNAVHPRTTTTNATKVRFAVR
ncbi:hypothetical protein H257_10437 [Aphanomyces astaci]|uniref:Uncharacterized protein n=1 Tax=Aphanomyces astaci TaxID=112090 RepID=W4G6E1_APHAT|nr:hypothetical protein H257_10437 [Aphanomyces astaci]ETV75245.1 hypothetical protein H257_10437 [Aphanomyces astaci]|eukprot:XP_009835293.1 hypothetical protein H257_10437 [Aphanomyces astaci]